MNSFLALREQDLAAFDEERRTRVRQRVERELHSAEFVASIVELFGPVAADTLNVMSGGQTLLDEPPTETTSR
jgi:hypothetical protein